MSDAGFFIDWDGNVRATTDPGNGYMCDVDRVARYVAVTTKTGTLVHEATLYRSLDDVTKAGISSPLVDGSVPWGTRQGG